MGSTTLTNGATRYLDNNSKLSSAGAAASLKYAKPQDLPSYPSIGLPPSNRRKNDAAAGAAASLGWANQKPLKIWKPDASNSAATAASIGWNRQVTPPWQPQQSANGARAALLAAKSDQKVPDQKVGLSKPKASVWGNSAANLAMKNNRTSLQNLPNRTSTLDRHGSLMAATGAMASPRQRADSTPPMRTRYPDEMNARSNALRAATHADTASRRRRSEIPLGGATPLTNMRKNMYTSRPVQPSEADQKQRADSMHASAIAMAQQMYKTMQKHDEETPEATYKGDSHRAATSAQGRKRSTSLMSVEPTSMNYNNLQEAAEKLAQERLAKLHDDHAKNREYLDYYGSRPHSKLYRDRFRRRASSDTSLDDGQEGTQDIRYQMPLYSSNLSRVDSKTRQKDRDMLLAVAQRNVAKSLQGIDEQVYAQTGRMTPSMMGGRETRPIAIAKQRVQPPIEQHTDKIDIGSGALVDRSSVDELALRNVQPVLNQIQSKSEAEKARQTEIMLDEEETKRIVEIEKTRDRELKEINKQLKEHDKKENKAKKSGEKAFKRNSKRMSKQSIRSTKSKSTQSRESSVPVTMAMSGAVDSNSDSERIPPIRYAPTTQPVEPIQPTTIEDQSVPVSDYIRTQDQTTQAHPEVLKSVAPIPSSPNSHTGVRTWLKSAFRRTSKGQKEKSKHFGAHSPFVGGASLTQPDGTPPLTNTAASKVETTQEVPVSRYLTVTDGSQYSDHNVSNVGMVSNPIGEEMIHERRDDKEESEEARDHFNDADVAMPIFNSQRPLSPARDSRFREVI